jgi:hypothetical protein
MRRIAMAACILVATMGTGALQAQALYICASSAGHSYQQRPCSADTRLIGSLMTTPEPPPSPSVLALREKKALQDRAESEFLSRMAGTDRRNVPLRGTRAGRPGRYGFRRDPQAEDACQVARADRQRVLHDVGLARTIDLMRSLDAAVWKACNH